MYLSFWGSGVRRSPFKKVAATGQRTYGRYEVSKTGSRQAERPKGCRPVSIMRLVGYQGEHVDDVPVHLLKAGFILSHQEAI